MFKKEDVIVYASTGVCLVVDIGKPEISGLMPEKDYYTLQPLSDSHREMIYVPVDTKAFMRLAVNRDNAKEYIASVEHIVPVEPQGKNPKATSDFYSRLIGSYDVNKLLSVIVSLVLKRRELTEKGKRLNQTQLTYLKRRQELVYNEFSIALDLPREEVEKLIEDNIR